MKVAVANLLVKIKKKSTEDLLNNSCYYGLNTDFVMQGVVMKRTIRKEYMNKHVLKTEEIT